MTEDSMFQVGAPGIDTRALLQSIRETVDARKRQGFYSDPRITRAERTDMGRLRGQPAFLALYLECLRDAIFVDINDFEIADRRRGVGSLVAGIKRALWQCLKFYTYRLWSQQNEVNGLLLSAVESLEEHYGQRIRELEEKVVALEKGPSV